ncbi:hypothetical protein ESCOCK390B1_18815 [Escherichia coli]
MSEDYLKMFTGVVLLIFVMPVISFLSVMTGKCFS